MKVWFDGEGEIEGSYEHVKSALERPGSYHLGVVTLMPGLANVKLIEEGPNYVTIETNEGLMKRTNISRTVDAERIVLEYDEEYAAGRAVTATSHFQDTFTPSGAGVHHHLVISGVEAPGVLGFIYRKFASGNIGKAFLEATRKHLSTATADGGAG